MLKKKEFPFETLKKNSALARKLFEELKNYFEEFSSQKYDEAEKRIINEHIEKLKENIKKINNENLDELKKLTIGEEDYTIKLEDKPAKDQNYEFQEDESFKSKGGKTYKPRELKLEGLEIETIRRLKESRKKVLKISKKKLKKQSKYSEIASKTFSVFSKQLLGRESFQKLEIDLVKANLDHSPTGYISLIMFTTLISFIIGGFIMLFFLFFNLGVLAPFVTRVTETINIRFLKVFWIIFAVPIATFVMMYIYPSLEKKSSEFKIDTELPFATIHMAAISGSMINPIKIFDIIISTNEYPALSKEFTKLLNEINIYGSDFVSALKNTAKNTSSKRLSELLNGLATTINSGGDLPQFFEKRADTLLFEYKTEREKVSKAAEAFMNIYISVVIATPMMLMLLLMMMKMSGLGLTLSVNEITIIMVLGVVVINIVFLAFLHLKKQT